MSNAINELSTELPLPTTSSTTTTLLPQSPKLPENHITPSDTHAERLVETLKPNTKTATIIPIPSFTVLNNDSLAILSKPNAIVRPIRRIAPLGPGPGPGLGPESSDNYPSPKDGQEIETFAKALDRKLRRLRNASPFTKSSHSSKNGSNAETINKRPLFITTVPTGVFLPPAKEPPIQPSKRVYAFATHPRVYADPNTYKDRLNDTIKGPDKGLSTRLHGIRAFSHFLGGTKKREPKLTCEAYKNLMFERRVVRGSNFAPIAPEDDPCLKEAEFRRRQCLRLRCKQRNQRNIIGTPPPVNDRRHERVQTEKYLEELYERPPEYDANTQTDLFLERPVTPPFIPEKVGIDASTEIIEGDLFDFDREVQPILETLVGHTVEQSILEVTHEEEVADLRTQQQSFLSNREIDLDELRRLEAEELRLKGEKERRIRQDEIAKELDEKMQKGVTAAKLLQGHIASLLPEVMANLEPATDEARKTELELKICPWLSKEVAKEVGQILDSREILTAIIVEIIKERATIYAGYEEEEDVYPCGEEEEELALEPCRGEEDGEIENCDKGSKLELV